MLTGNFLQQQMLLTRVETETISYDRAACLAPKPGFLLSRLQTERRFPSPANSQSTQQTIPMVTMESALQSTKHQSSKPISRDDEVISFEPIRALSNHNIQQRIGQHILARTTSHFRTTPHKTTEPPPEQPIRNFRTSNHVTTEPSSDKPIKMYRTHWPTPSRENHQILQDLSPRDNASRIWPP